MRKLLLLALLPELTFAATKTHYRMIEGAPVSVVDFGAKCDGTTTDTAAIAAAIAAAPVNGAVIFPAGVCRAFIEVHRSNIALLGAGSGATTIRLPDNITHTITVDAGPGTATGVPSVIDVGWIGAGNYAPAVDSVLVAGMTLDGNKAAEPAPAVDLFGWGLSFTKASRSHYSDIRVVNTHAGGVGVFINSNYTGGDAYVEGCGFNMNHPGLDLNSSKYGIHSVTVNACKYGVRILDNCWGNRVTASIYNPTATGVVLSNQTVNESHDNHVVAMVEGGAADYAAAIGANVRNSHLTLTANGITGVGLRFVAQADPAHNPTGITADLNTRLGGGEALVIDAAVEGNTVTLTSWQDGRQGAPGDHYAAVINGNRNTVSASITDSSTWHYRGIQFGAAATDNVVPAYTWSGIATPIQDMSMANHVNYGPGVGPAVASAATIDIPAKGSIFHVTGTAGITTINVLSSRTVTLIFDGILTVTNGSNLRLNGNFTTAAGSTLTLSCDGTNWYEISRKP